MTDFHTRAELVSHYKAVQARMGLVPQPRVIVIPKPEPPPPAAPDVLAAILTLEDFLPPTRAQILRAVCDVCGVKHAEVISHRRFHYLVRARMIFYHLARTMTGASMPQIGKTANRDHTTVLHGLRVVAENFDDFKPDIDRVMARLEAK